MTDTYTITIASNETGSKLAIATVEINGSRARLTEVRAETLSNESIPEVLAHLDYSLLIRTAAMLASPRTRPRTPQPGTL
ncbi:hypothetical protein ACIP5Y_00030 [Nocardia sp. NPDC088792]|uniref:hypothetical protein n=1 Tax=Nocardia sp. NPDC088792 TaxID=3364332 RepID=UPI0037FC5375